MQTPVSNLLTQVILAVFRANGRLLSSGDALAAPLGLTSARWQVLGAIAMAGRPLSAPQIGAAMGISRQGSQKQLNLLLDEGMLEALPNPNNKRSPLYRLTPRATEIYAELSEIQVGWAEQLGDGLAAADLTAAKRVLDILCERLAPRSEGGLQ
ncbi:MAG: MarR family transcriptional regulator [Rhodocyclaceae bacterium]